MNIFKDPQYAPLKAVLIIVLFIGLGAFALKASRSNSLEQTGQVIDGKPVMLTTLKTGVRNNAEVKALQTFLTKNKLFAGKIDGNFGKDTAEAVKKFQSNYKLMPSGTFGQSWVDENPSLMPPGDEVGGCGIDLNVDGVTNVADLDILMAAYGTLGENPADLDNDGVVGSADVMILMGAYGENTNCVLVVSLTYGENEVNQAHVIQVESNQDTDEVPVLAFTLTTQGNQDLLIEEIPVRFTSTEATGDDPDDLLGSVYLMMDGEVLDEKPLTATDSNDGVDVVIFDGFEVVLDAGDTANLTVVVDVNPTSSLLDAGDTLKAEITELERDGMEVDAEGDSLPQNQRIGIAIGEASEFRDVGLLLNLVSTNTNGGTMGTFTLTFTATAFGDDVYVDKTTPNFMGTINTAGTDESDLNLLKSGVPYTNTTPPASTIFSPTAETLLNSFLVEEGDTEQFSITTSMVPSVDGLYQVSLGNLAYSLSDIDATTAYTVNLDGFQTEYVFLDAN